MRDIIWTVIIIWVIWRIIEAFRTVSSSSGRVQGQEGNQQTYQNDTYQNKANNQPKKGELKSDAGECVDYEEIK